MDLPGLQTQQEPTISPQAHPNADINAKQITNGTAQARNVMPQLEQQIASDFQKMHITVMVLHIPRLGTAQNGHPH